MACELPPFRLRIAQIGLFRRLIAHLVQEFCERRGCRRRDRRTVPRIDRIVDLVGRIIRQPDLALIILPDQRLRTPEQQKARNRYPFPFEAVINPIWYATSPEMAIETEGCLSIPGFKADVCRYWAIEVEGFQPNGQRKTWSLKGWPARIFQHEIDHLDGRLLTDCMLPRTLTSTEPHGTGASSDLLDRLAISIQLPTEK